MAWTICARDKEAVLWALCKYFNQFSCSENGEQFGRIGYHFHFSHCQESPELVTNDEVASCDSDAMSLRIFKILIAYSGGHPRIALMPRPGQIVFLIF